MRGHRSRKWFYVPCNQPSAESPAVTSTSSAREPQGVAASVEEDRAGQEHPRPSTLLFTMSVLYALILPVVGLGAIGVLAAVVIEVGGATPGAAGPGLIGTLIGLLLLVLPLVVIGGLIVMWVAYGRGNDRLARKAALWPVAPLIVGLLVLGGIWLS